MPQTGAGKASSMGFLVLQVYVGHVRRPYLIDGDVAPLVFDGQKVDPVHQGEDGNIVENRLLILGPDFRRDRVVPRDVTPMIQLVDSGFPWGGRLVLVR